MSNQYISDKTDDRDVFQALADPTRRAILTLLRQGSQPVGSIARDFPISRPAISRHLRILREAELVSEIKIGRNRLYELNAGPLQERRRLARALPSHVAAPAPQSQTLRRTERKGALT